MRDQTANNARKGTVLASLRERLATARAAAPRRQAAPGPDAATLVVPVDFAPSSRAALRHAARLARRDGVSLHLMHVYDVPPVVARQGSSSIETLLEVEQQARTRLEALARSIDVEARTEYRVGDPSGVIASRAEQLDAERIVMGSHRHAGPGPIGSVARAVRREAPCPVTLVVAPRT